MRTRLTQAQACLLGEVFGILRCAPMVEEEAIYPLPARHGRSSDTIGMSYYRKKGLYLSTSVEPCCPLFVGEGQGEGFASRSRGTVPRKGKRREDGETKRRQSPQIRTQEQKR